MYWTFNVSESKLSAYFRLRSSAYREQYKLNLPDEQDEYDQYSRIAIATANHNVIGGVRLTLIKAYSLPLLAYGIAPENYLPLTSLGANYGEVSRLAVNKNHRSINLIKNMFILINNECVNSKISSLLAFQSERFARLTSYICASLGINTKSFKVTDIHIPDYKPDMGQFYLIHILTHNCKLISTNTRVR